MVIKIAIEGSDGAGKKTQSGMLKDWFTESGKSVTSISFPRYKETAGGWALFEALRGENAKAYDFANVDPYAASLFYSSDRRQSLPYLEELIATHDVVIFDRYVESNLLHQGGKFSTKEERQSFGTWLYELEYNTLALPKPDIVVYLELPFKISQKRAKSRAEELGDKLDAVESDEEYLRNSHEAGIFYAQDFKWLRIPCVGKDGSELTPEEVHQKVINELVRNFL